MKKQRSSISLGKTLEERYGIEKAKEIRMKLSNRLITQEYKDKISKSKKEKKLSDKHKQSIRLFMSDDKKNRNVDQTLYRFKNIYSEQIIEKRKIDMKKEYGCTDICMIINGKRKTSHGWILLERLKENEN